MVVSPTPMWWIRSMTKYTNSQYFFIKWHTCPCYQQLALLQKCLRTMSHASLRVGHLSAYTHPYAILYQRLDESWCYIFLALLPLLKRSSLLRQMLYDKCSQDWLSFGYTIKAGTVLNSHIYVVCNIPNKTFYISFSDRVWTDINQAGCVPPIHHM